MKQAPRRIDRRRQRTNLSAALGGFGASVGLAFLALSAGCERSAPPPVPERSATATGDRAAETSSSGSTGDAGGNPQTTPEVVTRTVRSSDGGFVVRWSTDPDPIPTADPFFITLELFADDACSVPLPLALDEKVAFEVAVDAAMPHHGHGMNVRPIVKAIGPARYRASGMLFHMPGRWELFFDCTSDGQTERAQTTIEIK